MCLLSVAWQSSVELPVIFAGNRDEYHARSSAAAGWWDDQPAILGGRDLVAGGSWLGINKNGRVAVVTNRPDLQAPEQDALSRGELVSGWLASPGATNIIPQLPEHHQRYGGFSLLLGQINPKLPLTMEQLSGGNGIPTLQRQAVQPGISGLSNTAIESPWPKLSWLNRELEQLVAEGEATTEQLFALLRRDTPVSDAHTGWVSTRPFIAGSDYGTRCSTVVIVDQHGLCRFIERRFGPDGVELGESAFEFSFGA
jgi:uncharacterized protein with NRDE domain